MLLEVDLAGTHAEADPNPAPGKELKDLEPTEMTPERRAVIPSIRDAGAFLDAHPLAKIIVVIDTHCLEENGLLVYSDDSEGGIDTCTLETVSYAWGRAPTWP